MSRDPGGTDWLRMDLFSAIYQRGKKAPPSLTHPGRVGFSVLANMGNMLDNRLAVTENVYPKRRQRAGD